MDTPTWPAPPSPPGARRRGPIPGWLKACGVGLAAFVLGTATAGGDTEPVDAGVVRVTQTETETETERSTERVTETETEAAPTVTMTEAGPTVTVTEAAPAVAAAPQPFVEPEPAPQPPPAPAPAPPSTASFFENCDAARAAGAAPLYAGDPGYRAGLDRDDDGVACE